MLRRSVLALARRPLSTMASQTPMEDAMRRKVSPSHPLPKTSRRQSSPPPQITEALKPSHLEIHNDSSLHAHHQAMAGNTSKETHFRVVITSEAFRSKMQPARHRMVYALLTEEMAMEGGIHALQLRTRTPEEEERQAAAEGKGVPVAGRDAAAA